MKTIVFTGPTLSHAEGQRLLPEATFVGPGACGDVLRAVAGGYGVIALIDGYLDQRQPVWHKEILWALSRGCHVWGAASMGALRAAELEPFGMRGVGSVFAALVSGALEADDEVVVVHEAADRGYHQLSEALVNIRATLREAVRCGAVTEAFAGTFCRTAQARFYAERTYERVFETLPSDVAASDEAAMLRQWLGPGFANSVNLKHRDALALMAQLARDPAPAAERPAFTFEPTQFWLDLHSNFKSLEFGGRPK